MRDAKESKNTVKEKTEMKKWKLDGSDNDAIREFLADPNNIHNCEQCPYKMKSEQRNLPCGQQNCWVELTCK